MKTKYFIFDLDGTLLNSRHFINYSSIEAINNAKVKGHKFMIATGRSYQLAISEIKFIDADHYSIICNGGLLYDVEKNEVIENSEPLNKEVIRFFIDKAKKYESSFLIYSKTDNYFYCANKEGKIAFQPFLKNSIDMSNLGIEKVERFLETIPVFTLTQFSDVIDEYEFMSLFDKLKNKNNYCNLSSALKGFVDIYSHNTSKWTGFLTLQKKLDIDDVNDVYYFGDSMNDYEMFKNIPNSIAMGNAHPELKKIAKYIIEDNNSDAIANFINEFLNQ